MAAQRAGRRPRSQAEACLARLADAVKHRIRPCEVLPPCVVRLRDHAAGRG